MESILDEFRKRLGEYVKEIKRKEEEIMVYLTDDFFNLKKNPIVNFVRGLLEERV